MASEAWKEKLKEIKEWKGLHFLRCIHSFNSSSSFSYLIPINVLNKTKSGNTKIEVFGYRCRPSNSKRVKYIDDETRIISADTVL